MPFTRTTISVTQTAYFIIPLSFIQIISIIKIMQDELRTYFPSNHEDLILYTAKYSSYWTTPLVVLIIVINSLIKKVCSTFPLKQSNELHFQKCACNLLPFHHLYFQIMEIDVPYSIYKYIYIQT
jgi:hypothetical protein